MLETIFLGLALVEGVLAGGWPGAVCTMGTLLRVEALNQKKRCLVFMSQRCTGSIEDWCICRAKSSSSQFTDSKCYEKDFQSCFGLHETRPGDICNACVLLLERWKKLPAGSKQNKTKQNNNKNKTNKQTNKNSWNHLVDARAGPSLKRTLKPKKVKTLSGHRMKTTRSVNFRKNLNATILMLTTPPQVSLQPSLRATVTSSMRAHRDGFQLQ